MNPALANTTTSTVTDGGDASLCDLNPPENRNPAVLNVCLVNNLPLRCNTLLSSVYCLLCICSDWGTGQKSNLRGEPYYWDLSSGAGCVLKQWFGKKIKCTQLYPYRKCYRSVTDCFVSGVSLFSVALELLMKADKHSVGTVQTARCVRFICL